MLLLFYQRKSYRHPALRDHAEACVVYDNWQILGAKVQILFVNWHFLIKKMYKKSVFVAKRYGNWCLLHNLGVNLAKTHLHAVVYSMR